MHANDNMPAAPALMSIREACALTSLSRTAINNLRRAGGFPPAVDLGERRIAFVRSEVDGWIHDRIAARQYRKAA
jgi:prophage regulatory protein